MKKSTIIWTVVIIVVLGALYLMSRKTEAPVTSTSTPTSTEESNNTSVKNTDTSTPTAIPLVNLATDAKLGKYLVASNSMTLYMYSKDTKGVSNCSGTCATAWPPYTPSSYDPIATGYGVDGELGTVVRADGTKQLTYKGIPLYFYKSDAKPSDVKGQNVGGVWFIVKP